MFDSFQERILDGDGARIFARIGGPQSAPPLLLLHGYPQTSAMWHLVAPLLARRFRVICPDLRGYGRSDKPASDADHLTYSKRAMAADMVALMSSLGHERFRILAHDRGARVAHRLGMDFPKQVGAMMLLDIAPTREMYAGITQDFAIGYWHWYFLIQPAPLPEDIIGADPDTYWMRKCTLQARGNPFAAPALAEYLDAFRDPDAIRASCEDYRAAASIDIAHDNSDGDRKLTMPVHVLWAEGGVVDRCFDPLALWRTRAVNVTGHTVRATHYMAEEIPDDIAQEAAAFLYPETSLH